MIRLLALLLVLAVVAAVFGWNSLLMVVLALAVLVSLVAWYRLFGSVKRLLAVVLVVVALVAAFGWYTLFRAEPERTFASIEEEFKYGSIGTEQEQGIPYWIWLVLPRLFPEYLPGPGGYASVGLPWEPAQPTPVGFARRKIGYDRIGINCAFCHTATVRDDARSVPRFYAGGPSHTFDVLAYQNFLFESASDPRFNADNILQAVEQIYEMPFIDRLVYRYLLIPGTAKALREQKEQFDFTATRPAWGRGRIDPFNPVKVSTLGVEVGDTIGNADTVPIWNLRARAGMAYHWDGLNTNIRGVFLSSAIGDGATSKSLPCDRIEAFEEWLMDVKPPRLPFPIDEGLAAAGEPVFTRVCAECHATGGALTGSVIPVEEVGTDPHRAEMWTEEAAGAYNDYPGACGHDFTAFRSTGGYVAVPLDGIWIRAPYLHNGSVPYLDELLAPPSERTAVFHRGFDVYNPARGGFVSEGPEAERFGTVLDTTQPGNSNQGHRYGTDLEPEEKKALLEYLKTL
jgi:mono/diheme cytochrome c family protein